MSDHSRLQIFRSRVCRCCQKEIDDPSLSEKILVLDLFPYNKLQESVASDSRGQQQSQKHIRTDTASVQTHTRYPHHAATATRGTEHTVPTLRHSVLSTFAIRLIRHPIFISDQSPTNCFHLPLSSWTTAFTVFFSDFGSRTRVDNCPTFFSASAQRPRKKKTAPTASNPIHCSAHCSAHCSPVPTPCALATLKTYRLPPADRPTDRTPEPQSHGPIHQRIPSKSHAILSDPPLSGLFLGWLTRLAPRFPSFVQHRSLFNQ